MALLLALAGALAFPALPPFQAGRLALFDRYQRVFPRQPASAPIVIVEIDEASLKAIGQWPWPRNRTAELIEAIAAMKPLAIGLDMYMPERDQTSPEAVAQNLPAEAAGLGAALRRLPPHDGRLAAALRSAPTVLGAAGFDFATQTTTRGLRTTPLLIEGGDALGHLRRYPYVLASLPELQAAASGQALLSVDLEDGIVRRIPLVAAVNDQPVPSLAMEMLRVATGSPAVGLRVGSRGIEEVRVADLAVPTQDNGEVWLHFAVPTGDRYVSAADVLAGKADPARFADKLALVGLTGFGLADVRATPLGGHVPGIDIQAQLIESFFDGRFLLRPAWMRGVEIALLFAGGLLLIWAVPRLRPRNGVLLAGTLVAVLFGAGFAAFRAAGLLFDAASVAACLVIVLGSLLASVFVETDRRRRRAEDALHLEREAAARVAGELHAARRIQLGTLPDPAAAFPGEARFEVAALLEPAREVGGDLYDCFMLDARRLFFAVGDVSGKGLPASLFMAVTKALAKSAALRGDTGIAAIVETANMELSRENPEMLFVTLAAGILDAETGEVELVNAGHDIPWRIGAGGPRHIAADGGPPLCVIEGFAYPVVRLALAPGESLCLVTDGVTEAMNAANEIYGTARLAAALAGAERSAAGLVAAVRADVRIFVDAAEPSDDLTLLALRWIGSSGR